MDAVARVAQVNKLLLTGAIELLLLVGLIHAVDLDKILWV